MTSTRMSVLYGVNGESLGHATRSQVVIAALLERGRDVRVVASGRAFSYLRARLPRELARFLARLPRFEAALAGYAQDGSRVALATIEARMTAAAADSRRDRRRARQAARGAV